MKTSYRMTEVEIAACSDDELQRIANLGKSNPLRFGTERKLALIEMGARVASEHLARERANDDRHYVAREGRDYRWYVWDCVSDHRVDFN